MRDLTILSAALEIVEKRLCEQMNAADLAKACFSSYSGLQKLFGYAFDCSVSEYITKRRLSRASNELLTSNKSITDIALDYQYEAPEAFSRAFRRFWGITPSEFRKTRRFSELLPKFKIDNNYGGYIMSTRKPIDVSRLYDELKLLGGTYAFGIDIAGFEEINNKYGYAAGDIVIAEAFARIERELSDNMLLFRTGGDEFAVVTAYKDEADAKLLAQKISAKNNDVAKTNELEIPFSLRIGISQVPKKVLSYQKALAILSNAVNEARKTPDGIAVYEAE
ncbi:MAG: helix-turn-helix domain-containing protein [Oscillospiraceae bacterium]|nr:helix-turn-helix domain-containing protein [Oscillospiraceae bacterium]